MTHPHEGLQERALREALKKCRQQFEYYVQQHMAKTSPDMDKAATNQEFVELCEFALSSTPPVPQDQGLRDALEKKLIEAQAIVSCMAHRPSCVLGDDMCLCGLSQLDRVLRLPAETTLPQQAATDEAVKELADMLDMVTPEQGTVVFDHTAEEIGLHVMENYKAIRAALSTPTAQPPAAETRLRDMMAKLAASYATALKPAAGWTADQVGWWEIGVADAASTIACAIHGAALTQPEPTAQQGAGESL